MLYIGNNLGPDFGGLPTYKGAIKFLSAEFADRRKLSA